MIVGPVIAGPTAIKETVIAKEPYEYKKKRKADGPAKKDEQKCLHPYVSRFNIQKRCQKKKGHWGKHV